MEGVSASDVKLFHAALSGDKEGVTVALAQGGKVTVRHSGTGCTLGCFKNDTLSKKKIAIPVHTPQGCI